MPPSHASLSDEDDLLRYVPSKLVDGDVVAPDAFLPRDRDFDANIGAYGVSCNWLQYFPPPEDSQVNSVRKVSRMTLKSSGRFVKINVGTARRSIAAVGPVSRSINFIRDELTAEANYPADDSHAVITGLTALGDPEDKIVLQLLVESISSQYPGRL